MVLWTWSTERGFFVTEINHRDCGAYDQHPCFCCSFVLLHRSWLLWSSHENDLQR